MDAMKWLIYSEAKMIDNTYDFIPVIGIIVPGQVQRVYSYRATSQIVSETCKGDYRINKR